MKLIRIPTAFYNDHAERELPAPPIMHRTTRHYLIDAEHPDTAELLDDAKFYADPDGPIGGHNERPEYLGLSTSAKATVNAIEGTK